jgi:hypothetical protein
VRGQYIYEQRRTGAAGRGGRPPMALGRPSTAGMNDEMESLGASILSRISVPW